MNNKMNMIIVLLIAIILSIVASILYKYVSSEYTLPTGTMSLMSLQEFSTVPQDIKDLYNQHIASHISPLFIEYMLAIIEKNYTGGLTAMKRDVPISANRLADEIRRATIEARSVRVLATPPPIATDPTSYPTTSNEIRRATIEDRSVRVLATPPLIATHPTSYPTTSNYEPYEK